MSLDSLASQSKPKAPSKVQKRHSDRVRCRQAEYRDSDGESSRVCEVPRGGDNWELSHSGLGDQEGDSTAGFQQELS